MAEFQRQGAVQIIVAIDPPQRADVLESGVEADLSGNDGVAIGSGAGGHGYPAKAEEGRCKNKQAELIITLHGESRPMNDK